MKTITLEVTDPVAEKIERMSVSEKKAVSETLRQLLTNRRNLDEIVEDIRGQAERNGLTPEVLDKILKEIDEETQR
jgi:predicted CopG family antitoxin